MYFKFLDKCRKDLAKLFFIFQNFKLKKLKFYFIKNLKNYFLDNKNLCSLFNF